MIMSINTIIVIAFILMVLVLFQGLYHMLKAPKQGGENQKKLVRSLTWRIGIWVALFIFIVVTKKLNWLEPSNSMHPVNFQKEVDARDKE
jgi:membrane protease YdiL (CAAX protease family)